MKVKVIQTGVKLLSFMESIITPSLKKYPIKIKMQSKVKGILFKLS